MFEHVDLLQWLFMSLIGIIAWVVRNWLASQMKLNEEFTEGLREQREKCEEGQKDLHGRITHVDVRLSALEGAHKAFHD